MEILAIIVIVVVGLTFAMILAEFLCSRSRSAGNRSHSGQQD